MKAKKALAGFTMIEMLISTLVLGFITAITMTVFMGINNSYNSNNLYNVMKIYDQAGVNKLGSDITTSRIIIGRNENEAIGTTGTYSSNFLGVINGLAPFLANSQFTTTNGKKFKPTLAQNRILPVVDASVDLSTISSSPANVGNTLLIGVFDDSTPISWSSTTAPSCNCIRTASIDLMTIKYYFLAKDERNKFFLVCGTSKYYADYTQVSGLLNKMDNVTEKNAFMTALSSSTLKSQISKKSVVVEGIWKSDDKTNLNIYQYFYTLSLASGVLQNVGSSYNIPMSYFTMYNNAVSENYWVSKNNIQTDSSKKVPLMAVADNTGDGYPNGLEIAVTGASGAREVFIRLLSEANVSGRSIFNQTTLTATGKDSG